MLMDMTTKGVIVSDISLRKNEIDIFCVFIWASLSLGCGAESCRKVLSSNLGLAIRRVDDSL